MSAPDRNAAEAAYPSLGQLVAGDVVVPKATQRMSVLDPATGRVLGELPLAGEAEIQRALEAAQQGFKTWKRMSAQQRGAILASVAARMRADAARLAALVTLELGKPYKEALAEVEQAAGMWEWAAEEGKRAYGRVIPSREPYIQQMSLREPIGPVAGFSSWNAPLITPSRKIAGALGAGCSIVLKGSEETPATALALGQIAVAAGVPTGALSILFAEPRFISDRLLASPIIRGVTFTGSTAIGKHIAAQAMAHMKRPIMELGGHAPVLVFDDADLDAVIPGAVAAKFRNAGQVCISPTRFFVQKGIFARFCEQFSALAKAIVVGDGLAPDTIMGPLANARRVEAMQTFVDDARQRRLPITCGGNAITGNGFFHEPTVVVDVTTEAMVSNVEPFGPFAALSRFETIDEALALANRLPFGLASYVMTQRTSTANRCAAEIEAGSVIVNSWRVSLPETPFGGHKDSGLSSEGGTEGLQAFQNVKYVSIS